MSALRTPRSSGKVRPARLTDLAALGELSRLCQSDGADTRSLGLPVNGPPIGVFSLFRLPLGAFRPNDLMFVYEEDGRIAGLVRVERESGPRRMDDRGARCRRHGQRGRDPLSARPAAPARGRETWRGALPRRLRRRRRQRRAAHAGRVHALRRGASPVPGERPGPPGAVDRRSRRRLRHPPDDIARRAAARPAVRGRDARAGRPARGHPARRLGAPGDPLARAPLEPHARSCASPMSTASSRHRPAAARTGRSSTASSRSGSPRRTSRTTSRSSPVPRRTWPTCSTSVWARSRSRTSKGGDHRHDRGVIAPVRTYEAPIDRRLEEAGFDSIASVNLLMKETLVRVAEPALVPAGVR